MMKFIRKTSCVFIFIFICFIVTSEAESFNVDNSLLKITIKQGEPLVKILKVTGFEEESIEIGKNNLDFVSISEEKFHLEEGQEKEIILEFDTEEMEPGISFGEIIVFGRQEFVIPIILEVETKEVLFDSSISVPPEHSKVYAGEELVVENKIFNLENIGPKNVEISYFIKDSKGNVLFNDQENLAVEYQILNTKTMPISENSGDGNYLFGVIIKYESSIGTSSYFFKVSDKGNSEVRESNFFLWLVIFLLIGLVFFIIYYLWQRDKIFLELKNQYKNELKKELKYHSEAKSNLKKLEKTKKTRIKVIKGIYRGRKTIVRKLQKQKRTNVVEKKLKDWKKQGYNIKEFLSYSSKDKKDFKKESTKFKKQGYKI